MKIIWSRQAQRDKQTIWSFLSDRGVAYADRVELRIEARVESLAQFAYLGGPIPGTNRRKLSIPDIQHVVIYRIDDTIIRILRIRATAQDRGE